jgi:hypothetical protein
LGKTVWVNAAGAVERMTKLRSPPSDDSTLDCVCTGADELRSELECFAFRLKTLAFVVINARCEAAALAEPLAVRC